MHPPLYSILLILATLGSAMALGLTVWLAYACGRREVRHQVRVRALEQQLAVVVKGAVGMGRRVLTVEKKLQTLHDQQDSLQGSSDGFAYTQAMRMFDQGADVESVVSSCGLSSSEARLMALVRAHQSKPTRAPIAELHD